MSIDKSDGRYGSQDIESSTSEYNALVFLVNQILSGKNSATLMQVKAVTTNGGVAPVGYVDAQPMVNQLDGQGVAIPHGIVNNLPYFRLQGGTNAIIIDPAIGDIGMAIFADRDISSVKASAGIANPGSMRRSDMADGLYIGGFINAAPSQYIQFNANGITIVSPGAITMSAQSITMSAQSITMTAPDITATASHALQLTTGQFTVNGPSQFNGTINSNDTITAPEVVGGGKHLATHTHKFVKAGTDTSGPPT